MEPAAFSDSLLLGLETLKQRVFGTTVKTALEKIIFLTKFPPNFNTLWLIDHVTLQHVFAKSKLLLVLLS